MDARSNEGKGTSKDRGKDKRATWSHVEVVVRPSVVKDVGGGKSGPRYDP